MADTVGLLKTRGEWINAVESGETTLTHKDWYDQKYSNQTKQTDEEKAKQVKSAYDKVASKSMARKTLV